MRMRLLGFVCYILVAMCGFSQPSGSQSYTNSILPGLNLIANQLDAGSNTLNEIMPNVPDGCALYKYINSDGTWAISTFSAAAGRWFNGEAIALNPGDGAWLESPTNFQLVFTGTPNVPVLPVAIPAGSVYLLSRQTNDIGTYENTVGTPVNSSTVWQWNVSRSTWDIATYQQGPKGGVSGWFPSELTAPVGTALWVSPAGGGAPATAPSPFGFTILSPTNGAYCAGSTQTITWSGGNPSWNVEIELGDYAHWVVYDVITPSTPNSGSFVWNIPVSVPTGVYFIYIQEVHGITWTYGGIFTINGSLPVINCATNKTVQCGSAWTFDPPTVTGAGCCGSNVTISVASTVTNGANPQYITRNWQITNACGATATCSQTVTVLCCVTSPPNMVLWLPFDEIHGPISANLASPPDYGTQFGGPTPILGAYVANSLDFNSLAGAPQYVTVPDYPAIDIGTGDLTIDAWVNRATNAPNSPPSVIVDKRDANSGIGYGLSLDYGNLIFTMSGNNFRDTATVPADGQWHFVAVSLNQSSTTPQGQFYVDAGPSGTFTPTPGNLANTNLFWVAASPLGGNVPWLGGLDEVEVYNRALAIKELYAIYSAGAGGKCKPPCATGITVTCPTNKTVQCGSAWTFDLPSASSCCGSNVTTTSTGAVTNGVTITSMGAVTNGLCPKVITQTWLLTDACGNSGACSQTVTVVNTNPPALLCASNLTVSSGAAWSFEPPAADDACCTDLTITVLNTVTNLSANPCAISYTRTWQVMDCCSNTAACSQTVTVIPTSPCQVFNTGMNGPAALGTGATDPNFVLLSAPPGAGTSALVIAPASANSTYPTLLDGPDSQWIGPDTTDAYEPEGVYHYQLQFLVCCCANAAELSGQMAADNTAGVYLNGAPVASIPGFSSWTPINVASGFVCAPLINMLDIYVTNNGSTGEPGRSPTAFRAELTNCVSPFVVYCPTNKTVQCGSAWTFDLPSASSCCGSNVTITSTGAVTNGVTITSMGAVTNGLCPKVITQTWLLTDACGNSGACSQTVTVVNTNPPALLCASNLTVSSGAAWSFEPPAAADACCTDLTITVLNTVTNLSANPCAISYTRTWQVMDCCSNTAACSQTVTVLCCVTSPPNMVLWLPFDEIHGPISANLASPPDYGTQFGGPTPILGAYVANSLDFNSLAGVPQYVTVPDYPAIDIGTGDLTIDAWVNRATNAPNSPPSVIVDKRDANSGIGYGLSLDYGNLIFTMSGNNFRDTATVPADGQWHFVAVSLNQSSTTPQGQFYVDAGPSGTFTPTPGNLANTNLFWVAASPLGGNVPWLGGLDEVEVYNRALAIKELYAIYSAGAGGKCKPPCATGITVTCPTNKTVQCGSAWTFDLPSASSCCGSNVTITSTGAVTNGVTITSMGAVTNGLCPKVITQTWLLTDACGNSGACSQTVTVVNTNPPALLCASNLTVSSGAAWSFEPPAAADACCTDLTITVLNTVTNLSANPCAISYTRTWQVMDCCSNTAACSQTVTVLCCVTSPPNMVLWLPFDEIHGPISANLASPPDYGTQFGGPTPILGAYVANSLDFNSLAGVPQYVTVPDYPAIDIGTGDLTIDAWVNRATNAPNSPPSVIVDKRDANSGIGYGLSLDYGNLIFTMSGNNFRDTATVPADGQWHFVAVSLNQSSTTPQGQFYVDAGPSGTFTPTPGNLANTNLFWVAASPLGGNVPWLGGLDEVEVYNRALAIKELYAIYSAGAGGKCKPPCATGITVTCPTNKTVQCGSAWTFDLPSASSCCGSNVTITSTGAVTNGVTITSMGAMTNGLCPKVITQTWLLTDACGNSGACSQTVTVVDTTPPTISCPTNAIVVALNTNCALVIPLIHPVATDNCTPASQLVYTQSPPAGTIASGHSQVVTLTVTDLCGNSSQCRVLVLGEDKTGPVVVCPTNMTATNCLVPCVPVTATDNCCLQSSLRITQSPPCGTPIGPGIHSITVTVTDCNGNSTTRVVSLSVGGPQSFLGALFNTGVDGSGGLLADDTVDPHYALPPAAVPAGMPSDYFGNAVAVSDTCHPTGTACAWLNRYLNYTCYEYTPWSLPPDPAFHPAVSKWIAPDYTNNGCSPYGGYTYTLPFNLPAGFNPASAAISGRWAADNEALMYLNANQIPAIDGGATVNGNAGFAQWTHFIIPAGSGFVSGPNTLTFVVTNTDPSSWTGLRVEFTSAFAGCSTCAPPAILSITPGRALPVGGVATFNVNAAGTPPLSYQWCDNNVKLANNGHDSGVTTSTLQVHPLGFSDGGLYSVLVSNSCGVATGYVRLNVTQPRPWNWGWWDVSLPANPLAATVGPDLNLAGSSFAANYSLSAGTTEDFGLPDPAGQIVNVMHINPLPAPSIQVPLIAPPGSNSVSSYTVIMDLYEPDTSFGTPSTLFQSLVCCLGSSGQDGVSLTLDAQNNPHLTGSAAGVPFDAASAAPLTVDAWNRLALVIDDPQDGIGVNGAIYLNGQPVASLTVPTPIGLPINWGNSPPTLLSAQTNASAPNGEFYLSSIQFHALALTPQGLAGIGSPDDGPAPALDTSVGAQPVLSATLSNGLVNLTFSGTPFVPQETTDLNGVWVDSVLPFAESPANGSVLTTAVADPSTEGPAKFYRLIFRP